MSAQPRPAARPRQPLAARENSQAVEAIESSWFNKPHMTLYVRKKSTSVHNPRGGGLRCTLRLKSHEISQVRTLLLLLGRRLLLLVSRLLLVVLLGQFLDQTVIRFRLLIRDASFVALRLEFSFRGRLDLLRLFRRRGVGGRFDLDRDQWGACGWWDRCGAFGWGQFEACGG